MDVVITQKAFGRISSQKFIKFEPDSVCPSFPNTLYEKIHRHLDSEDNNVYKVLDNIKNKISIIQKVARNKFRKVTDEELDKIIEELSLTNTDKVAMLVGIYDMEV